MKVTVVELGTTEKQTRDGSENIACDQPMELGRASDQTRDNSGGGAWDSALFQLRKLRVTS